ncbi:PHP domain-containing protein [Nocardioides sp.]|uniref:PHP domain-containing protein n=1 Tax=Nocardioides sp. TaxID=35761 RepID=UPI00271F0163|nr:PHP domain-containing protein [Nocardioides sp.]MDO9456166.1 PHP domain-containing protein [Nocardioides sp.]
MRIDLHTHSVVSDGTQTPTELVHAAREAGLDVLALTDHDTASGWDEAVTAARETGLQLVRGMEISTNHQGRAVHLLAYLPDPTHPGLAAELARIVEGRGSRAPAMIAALHRIGIELTLEDIAAEVPGRPHVADALVRKGIVASRDEAFADYLNPGRPAYVDRYAVPLDTAIRLVGAAGGVAVVAHPWGRGRRGSLPAAEIERLTRLGLAGIEVDHQDHDADAREELRAIARDLDLVATGSSDHHGLGKVDHGLGVNTTPVEQYERLLDRAAAAARASGRVTPQVVG